MERGWEECPFQAHKVMVNGENAGDLSCFQTVVDITLVDAPSSIMHWETMALRNQTGILKVVDEGKEGCYDVSTEKTIK